MWLTLVIFGLLAPNVPLMIFLAALYFCPYYLLLIYLGRHYIEVQASMYVVVFDNGLAALESYITNVFYFI
jgi:hypothetical protein